MASTDPKERFGFGRNWKKYSGLIDPSRIEIAEKNMQSMLGVTDLKGKRFLDIGCGSGLMSLVAYRLGADVVSFDYDTDSVECSQEVKTRFAPDADNWRIEQGSVLDKKYMDGLGKYDVVYSWGVLHHTGDMASALANVGSAVDDEGTLFIAIYNDQGGKSKRWTLFKKLFNKWPGWLQMSMCMAYLLYWELRLFAIRVIRLQNPLPWKYWQGRERGMSIWYDAWDWLGGYPFEVAKPEDIFDCYQSRGFTMRRLATCGGGHGCNEYVFVRNPQQAG